jgi:hypothetical protein
MLDNSKNKEKKLDKEYKKHNTANLGIIIIHIVTLVSMFSYKSGAH